MAIYLREEANFKVSAPINSSTRTTLNVAEASKNFTAVDPNSLDVKVEGIHSNIITRNWTCYTDECLRKATPRWVSPYKRPVIMHHKENDGVIIGRVKAAEHITENTRSNTPATLFTLNIADKDGKEGVLNGTLETTSIGAIVYEAYCSICGQNIAEDGPCEHILGEVYDDDICYWRIEDMEPKEISYVIVPSDVYASNVEICDKTKKAAVKESNNIEDEVNNMSYLDEQIKALLEVKESQSATEKVVDEEVKDGDDKKPNKNPEGKKEDKSVEDKPAEPVEEPEKPEEDPKAPEDDKEPEDPKKDDDPKDDDNKEPADSNKDNEDDKTSEVDDLKARIKELEAEVADLKGKLKSETTAKESLNAKYLELSEKQKAYLLGEINTVRKSMGLTEQASETAGPVELLETQLLTLREASAITAKNIVPKIPKLGSESLVDDASDNTVKETEERLDVKESVSIEDFNAMMKKFYKK